MIDLNHILLFLAVVSPLAVLAKAWRPGAIYRGWRIAALIVLAVTSLAWIFCRPVAGYVGGGAWLALLFLPAIGLRRMADLAALQRYRAARKLAAVIQLLHPSAELRYQTQLFRTLEARQATGLISAPAPFTPKPGWLDRYRLRNAPAVFLFILLNIGTFILEISHRGQSEPVMLHQLGALEPMRVLVTHEYWRLLTSLFLHAGSLHLLFNIFALYVLGPPLERAIGSARFCACYLISGLGSGAGVVLLSYLQLDHADLLVGASGCVMGIVGAWGAFLLRHRHAPHARQRLLNVVMIVVIQTAFDLYTPQVSMSAHLCGLVTGFFVGLLIAPRRDFLRRN